MAAGQTPTTRDGKPGGVLKLMHREDLPQGFAIHETATNSVTWPAMPCYSNLVVYDQLRQLERPENIVPELAERLVPAGQLAQPVKNLVPHSVRLQPLPPPGDLAGEVVDQPRPGRVRAHRVESDESALCSRRAVPNRIDKGERT